MQDSASVTSSTKTNTMKSKQLIINGVKILAHSDGSIEKPNNSFKDKRVQRSFGSREKSGYMRIRIGNKLICMHRITAKAFLPDFLCFPQVDHIDGKKANNDVKNLRMTTNGRNSQSHQNKRKGCSSQHRGVSWYKRTKKWKADCFVNGKFKHIGYFDNEFDAAVARDAYWFSQGLPIEGLNFPEKYTKCA